MVSNKEAQIQARAQVKHLSGSDSWEDRLRSAEVLAEREVDAVRRRVRPAKTRRDFVA